LYVLVVWGAVDLCRGSLRHGRLVLNIVAGVILTSLLLISRVQTAYWRDSVSLWTHALACTSGNLLAHYNLGVALAAQGKLEAAGQHYERALQINPDSADVHNNLGWALVQQGKLVEATQHFERALQVEPNHAKAHYNLGNLLVERGKSDEAIEHFERALQLKSNFVAAHVKLGVLMAEQGKLNGAIDHFKQVLRIQPGDAQIRCHLGMAYVRKEQWHEALAQFQKALQIAPGGTLALNNLAWLLATCPEAAVRDGAKAVKLALELDRVSGGKRPTYLDTLAAAYAEAGRFADAVEVAKRAVALAHASAARQLAQEIEARLRLYEKGQPFREAARVDSRPTIGN
jgi:tetratricopeptide (TPR) repeat protein